MDLIDRQTNRQTDRQTDRQIDRQTDRQHDEITRSTFQQLIKCSVLNDQQWLQATLPIRFGGFGMLSAQSISSISFVSS